MRTFFCKSNSIINELFFKYNKSFSNDLVKKYENEYNIKIDDSNSIFFIFYFLKMNKYYFDDFEKIKYLINFFNLEYYVETKIVKYNFEASYFSYDDSNKTIELMTIRKGVLFTLTFKNLFDKVVK